MIKVTTLKGVYDSNTFIVECGSTCILIDAGAPADVVNKALAGRKIFAIFLTHEHFDHIFNLADYMYHFKGCPIYVHPATLEEIKTNQLNSSLGGSFGVKLQVKTVLRFDYFNTLSDNQYLSVAPLQIKAIFAPGHSNGSVVYSITDTQKSSTLLFTGDVLFKNAIGRTDLVPDGKAQMQKTLQVLQKLRFDTAYHGHDTPSDYDRAQKTIKRHLD